MKTISRNHCVRVHPRAHAAGFSMIEVLVAILILVFGIFGVAALQATALRNSQSAMQHSQAVVQTYAMLDRMRANVAQAKIGMYNLGTFGSDLGGTGTTDWVCDLPDAGGLPENERRDWIATLQDPNNLGPNACGIIDCDDFHCDIAVRWDDSRGKHSVSESTNQVLATRSRL